MNSKQFLESTTSGAIASVSTPVGKPQTRGKGVYPNEKGGNLLTGKVVEVLNTKATGTWDISSPNWGMDNFMFTASNGVLYQLDFLDPYIGPDELGPESFDFATNLDDAVWDKLVDSAKFISFEQVNVNDKYEPGKQGIEGTGAAAEVFGSVVNAIFDYIKKKRPSMLYFQAVEPNRIRLYKSMINRLLKKLPGWNAEQAGSRGAHFAVYNEQLLKRLASKKVKPMKEAQTMSQALANTLSKAEPGSKLDQKIKHHNSQVKQTGKGTLDKAPTGYHMDKKGYIRLGVSEAKLDEEDVIIVPGQGNRIKPGFIPRDKDRTDHEVEMAKSDLFQANKNAKKIYELIKNIPETVGIEGWVQEKIIKANDYLNTVREYLEHKQVDDMTGVVEQDVTEGVYSDKLDAYIAKLEAKPKLTKREWMLLGTAKDYRSELARKAADGSDHRDAPSRKGVEEGYRVLPSIDRERYGDRSYEGLEGPFRARNGKVYYYDPKAGMAYDPDTDIYIDYDELKMMDTDLSEGLSDDMMALARELGVDPKTRDLKNRVTKPASEPVKRSKLSAEKVAELKKRLSDLEAKLDPNFERSDDYGVYLHNRNIAQQIRQIKNLLKDQDDSLDEGIVGKVLGGAALLAALWGIGQHQAQQVYSNSPQLQTLIKYHQMATQQGDQAKIQELERRIENHKTRLSLGKGEVMGPDDKPIVPRYESSIMKGIQNEAKKIPDKCPECGGKLVAESELNEEGNKDACYHKVKSRYKVWPSAYASGALVKCRKVGASNWGNKSK